MQDKQTNKKLCGVLGEQSRQPGLEGLRSLRERKYIEVSPIFIAALSFGTWHIG